MIYLKMWESFDKERDEYWDEYLYNLNNPEPEPEDTSELLSGNQAAEYMLRIINFSNQSEIDSIANLFSDKYNVVISKWRLFNDETGDKVDADYIKAKRKDGTFEFKIFKTDDEWYLVWLSDQYTTLYCLCDQIEGLRTTLSKSIQR